MSAVFLEKYLESVEGLPSDLRRNFHLMRELDIQANTETTKLRARCEKFLEQMDQQSPADRKKHLERVQQTFKNTLDLCDQKVALAMQTYETVDEHIRQLDSDLKRFEAESAEALDSNKRRGDDSSSSRKRSRKDRGAAAEEQVDDMPVDPNEPTYCLCHQVSYGEMIACDNPSCPTEWYHFACVQLTEQPKSKWFCPMCQAEMDRKK